MYQYKIPTKFLTESSRRHTIASRLDVTLSYPSKDVWITMYYVCLWTSGCHYIHIHSCSTRNMLNRLISQRNPNCYPTNWMTCVLCQYYFGVDTAYFLQKGELNWYNIIAFNVPFDSTASTPFIWVHTPAAERIPTRRRKVKQIWGL